MHFKPGVVLYNLDPILAEALDRIDAVHRAVVRRDAIVTSARDGEHSEGSLHYVGRAVDVRTRDLAQDERRELAAALRDELGYQWDVVIEANHIHIEYQPD